MRCRWLPLALSLLLTVTAAAQTLDSLRVHYENALQSNNMAEKGIILSKIAHRHYESQNYDSSFIYYRAAVKINKAVSNDTLVAANYNDLARLHSVKSDFDSAVYYYESAINKFGDSDELGVAYAQVNLAGIYKDKGFYEKALALALSAEKVFSIYPDDRYAPNCYSVVGSIYSKTGEYQNALFYYKKGLALSEKKNDQALSASALNNIGNVLMKLGKYDSARVAFLDSYTIRKTLLVSKSTAIVLNNLGEVSLKLRQLEEAERYLSESLSIKRKLGDKLGQATTLNNLGDYHIQAKNFSAAQKVLWEADKIERTIGSLEQRKINLQLWITLNRATGNFKKASENAEELLVVKDSLLNTDKNQALANMQIRYETEKKDQQIEILNTEQKLNRTSIQARNSWIIALIIAISSILIIAALIYNSFRLARKGRRRVEILLKELHHRVKNNLQVLSSVLSLQSQSLTDENALLSVRSTEGRINAMALVHRKLYSDDQNTIVSTRGYFRELIEFLMSSYGYHEQNLKLEVDIEEIELDVDKAIPLGLIVNELISNAFKHAYTNQNDAKLMIKVRKQKNDLHVMIADNGKPTAEPLVEETKFGMRMVNILIRDIKGKFQTIINNGTEHSIIIPLA